jgi:hypothetical protein
MSSWHRPGVHSWEQVPGTPTSAKCGFSPRISQKGKKNKKNLKSKYTVRRNSSEEGLITSQITKHLARKRQLNDNQ